MVVSIRIDFIILSGWNFITGSCVTILLGLSCGKLGQFSSLGYTAVFIKQYSAIKLLNNGGEVQQGWSSSRLSAKIVGLALEQTIQIKIKLVFLSASDALFIYNMSLNLT